MRSQLNNRKTKLLTTESLAEWARKARGELTQEQVAQMLDVTKQAVSQAESLTTGSSMNRLRIRIVEHFTEHEVEGPFWRLREK